MIVSLYSSFVERITNLGFKVNVQCTDVSMAESANTKLPMCWSAGSPTKARRQLHTDKNAQQ